MNIFGIKFDPTMSELRGTDVPQRQRGHREMKLFTRSVPPLVRAVVFLTLFCCQACAGITGSDEPEYLMQLVPRVDSLAVLGNANGTLTLHTVSTVPTPCYEFSHREITRNGMDIEIAIYARVQKDIICIQVLGSITRDIQLTVDTPGEYRLIFPGSAATLDTTIVMR